jgi:hypothetical protein
MAEVYGGNKLVNWNRSGAGMCSLPEVFGELSIDQDV